MNKIVCFHLLNDYSGSPRVLRTVLEELLRKGYEIDLYTSAGGVLDELPSSSKLRKRVVSYRFGSHSLMNLCRFIRVQCQMFRIAFQYRKDASAVFYINTLLPIGPAWAARLMGKRLIYHYHEFMPQKGWLYRFLGFWMQRWANAIICVSESQKQTLKRTSQVYVIPNALSNDLFERLAASAYLEKVEPAVLMLASLKAYKGVSEFVQLAQALPRYTFILVLNATLEEVHSYFHQNGLQLPDNMECFPRQTDVVPFYTRARIVVNLSDKTQFVESFGLTVSEAMVAGIPVIVPTVGGVAEMVEDGENGFKTDVQHLEVIQEKIENLFTHPEMYRAMHQKALERQPLFCASRMVEVIEPVLTGSSNNESNG